MSHVINVIRRILELDLKISAYLQPVFTKSLNFNKKNSAPSGAQPNDPLHVLKRKYTLLYSSFRVLSSPSYCVSPLSHLSFSTPVLQYPVFCSTKTVSTNHTIGTPLCVTCEKPSAASPAKSSPFLLCFNVH